MNKNLHIALVGNPNCGKSALFNALTRSRQRVANYPGVTVEQKHGYFVTEKKTECTLIDLPGTYSLRSRSPDEKITRDVVFDQFASERHIDAILCILDATNLQNGLRLFLELKQIGKPIIVVLNMVDIAKRRGYLYNLEKLKQKLGCEIVETVAIKNYGINKLINQFDTLDLINTKNNTWTIPNLENSRQYHKDVALILNEVKIKVGIPSKVSETIDKVILHPISGVLILLIILFVLFQAVFSWAAIPKDLLQELVDYLQKLAINFLPNMLGSLVGNGIIAGVGAVIVFLPQILIISLFVILLEDSGYMARAAFLMDRIMSRAGLHGKAFIPLLSSFACAIPGIIATRTIENRNDRLITIMISPLITCSARIPIYTLLISAFIPNINVFHILNLQGLVMFLLYFIGIVFTLLVAFIFKLFFFKGQKQPSIMEIPSYKMPQLKNVIIELMKPAKSFLLKAGTTIVAIMIILWFLSTFPVSSPNGSFVGIIGHFLAPIFAPIGFSWQIVAALVPGMAAREVAVAALSTIYAVDGDTLARALQHTWTIATAFSLITWYIFAPQCISTLAVVRRETNSYKWTTIMFVYQILLAYAMAYIVYKTTLCMI